MLIDINVSCGRWPFQQYGPETPESLQAQLEAAGIANAYVSAAEAILAPDPSLEERRLQARIAGSCFFRHAPLVNPRLSDWKDALRRAREQFGSSMVKIIPRYHLYDVDGLESVELVREADAQGLRVALFMRVQDERMHYALMKVPPLNVEKVLALAKAVAPVPIMVLNGYFGEIKSLAAGTENLLFDIPYAEGADPMRRLVEVAGAGRILFGTNAPLAYPVAQAQKLQCGGLTEQVMADIGHRNAEKLLRNCG